MKELFENFRKWASSNRSRDIMKEYGGRPYDPTIPGDYERARDNPTGDAPPGGANDDIDDIRSQIDKEWQWLQGALYGHGDANDGMLSAWRQGIVNDEGVTIGAIENATRIAHRVRNVLHSNRGADPNIAAALESIDKLMSSLVEVRLQLLQAFGQLRGQPERLQQKISDIQAVNEGFLSQLFGYAYTALERNGLLTPRSN
tara:strand:- start:1952 stop:2554 length:603 start_codon:yes stop_codon:yes gene_type:complete